MNIPELGDSAAIADKVTGRNQEAGDDAASVDPKAALTYEFEIDWRDPQGNRWRGHFRNKVLTVGQRRQVKIIKAKLAADLTVAALDADVWILNEKLAHLMVSLDQTVEGFPKWARKLDDLFYEELIDLLYTEIVSHEATFLRRGSSAGSGESSG